MADIDPGSAVGSVLRMRLFGPSSFAVGGRELRFKSLKLRAALGYIALNESLTETRERLVGMLWSESGEDHARASLRQNIRELRIALDGSDYVGLYIASHEIGFESGTIELDVLTVMQAAEAGHVHPLLLERRSLPDELLAGLEDLDPSFRSWLLAKRHTIRDRLLRALENGLERQSGDLATQGNLAQAVLNLDPTHEDAARRLMRARAMMGDTAGALRVYKTLWDLLDEDYGMEPAEATQKLVADIKIGLFEPAESGPTSVAAVPAAAVPVAAARDAVVAGGPDGLHSRSRPRQGPSCAGVPPAPHCFAAPVPRVAGDRCAGPDAGRRSGAIPRRTLRGPDDGPSGRSGYPHDDHTEGPGTWALHLERKFRAEAGELVRFTSVT